MKDENTEQTTNKETTKNKNNPKHETQDPKQNNTQLNTTIHAKSPVVERMLILYVAQEPYRDTLIVM